MTLRERYERGLERGAAALAAQLWPQRAWADLPKEQETRFRALARLVAEPVVQEIVRGAA